MTSAMKLLTVSLLFLIIGASLSQPATTSTTSTSQYADGPQTGTGFPGVSRDVLPFCASRPSLPINLAMMVVHIKRDVSFNYKLYLISDNYVFQTGQVIPRDHFKIHAFPAKVRRLGDFWPNYPRWFMQPASNPSPSPSPSPAAPVKEASDTDDTSTEIQPVLPVASFSSFDINTTYLVRKDFGHEAPQILRLTIDAHQFRVVRYVNVTGHTQEGATGTAGLHWDDDTDTNTNTNTNHSKGPHVVEHEHENEQLDHDDYAFLSHPILTDKNTRIQAITQIYEDWITRNFYTIVYVQRRMSLASNHVNSSQAEPDTETDTETETAANPMVVIYDRLVFRGSSTSLLAADQLDYPIEAAAFITEKNKLHYWLEFLPAGQNRFNLRAIEWSQRPFKIHTSPSSWQSLDNEELVLCPPSVCHSHQPIDEIVDYGYIPLPPLQPDGDLALADDQLPVPAPIPAAPVTELSSSSSSSSSSDNPDERDERTDKRTNSQDTNNDLHASLDPEDAIQASRTGRAARVAVADSTRGGNLARFRRFFANASISFNAANYLSQIKLDTKLHLRDWIWPLHHEPTASKFGLSYDEAQRSSIKAKTDNYGYIITGHKVDASFRVFNEVYLISANLLITINYTQSNESVVTKSSLNSEYPGLESPNDDPITAAYYDRYDNQVYFIKGDRYCGYDFTKRTLQGRFVSSQTAPVVELIGYQIRVDAIYHNVASDTVYIFSGMRYITYKAHEFSEGYFSARDKAASEPRCINGNLLTGCRFDKAYKSPCKDRQLETSESVLMLAGGAKDHHSTATTITATVRPVASSSDEFYLMQQQNVRNLASLAGTNNKLVYNSDDHQSDNQSNQLVVGAPAPALNQSLKTNNPPAIVPFVADGPSERLPACASQTIITYLTVLSILLTSIVAIILVVIISNWKRIRMVMSSPKESHLNRATLNKIKNFHLGGPELINSAL